MIQRINDYNTYVTTHHTVTGKPATIEAAAVIPSELSSQYRVKPYVIEEKHMASVGENGGGD